MLEKQTLCPNPLPAWVTAPVWNWDVSSNVSHMITGNRWHILSRSQSEGTLYPPPPNKYIYQSIHQSIHKIKKVRQYAIGTQLELNWMQSGRGINKNTKTIIISVHVQNMIQDSGETRSQKTGLQLISIWTNQIRPWTDTEEILLWWTSSEYCGVQQSNAPLSLTGSLNGQKLLKY